MINLKMKKFISKFKIKISISAVADTPETKKFN